MARIDHRGRVRDRGTTESVTMHPHNAAADPMIAASKTLHGCASSCVRVRGSCEVTLVHRALGRRGGEVLHVERRGGAAIGRGDLRANVTPRLADVNAN